jgi:hypothetical protein
MCAVRAPGVASARESKILLRRPMPQRGLACRASAASAPDQEDNATERRGARARRERLAVNQGDPEYDRAFREFFTTILSSPAVVCARCARTFATHCRDAYLGEIDHDFEAQSLN